MLHAFWSVLIDLWRFLWGRQLPLDTYVLSEPAQPLSLGSRPWQATIAPNPIPLELVSPQEIVATTQAALPLRSSPIDTASYAQPGTIYYVASQQGALLFREAGRQFDSVLLRLRFGQSVSLKQFVGQYAEVLVFGVTGFVHKEDITPHMTSVWPVFVPSTVYPHDDAVTELVRMHLADEFLGGELLLPLQPGEYVTMRLMRDQLVIPWPKVRPRTPGIWHTLLRGVAGVHSGVTPISDSVMEWVAEDGEGKLAYVDAVLPDDTLKISAVGLVVEGEYTESVVPSVVWREWRPVFISIR
ncbi:MAG: hypothetical protein MUF19_01695 [Candidatus Pacebacteria bacterium]|jgi:hypothetical protein|nr:hypothetical protein [Candidatus Paceibacterota bacterium]